MKQPDDLPELSADLVPTLASLDVHDLSHLGPIKSETSLEGHRERLV